MGSYTRQERRRSDSAFLDTFLLVSGAGSLISGSFAFPLAVISAWKLYAGRSALSSGKVFSIINFASESGAVVLGPLTIVRHESSSWRVSRYQPQVWPWCRVQSRRCNVYKVTYFEDTSGGPKFCHRPLTKSAKRKVFSLISLTTQQSWPMFHTVVLRPTCWRLSCSRTQKRKSRSVYVTWQGQLLCGRMRDTRTEFYRLPGMRSVSLGFRHS